MPIPPIDAVCVSCTHPIAKHRIEGNSVMECKVAGCNCEGAGRLPVGDPLVYFSPDDTCNLKNQKE